MCGIAGIINTKAYSKKTIQGWLNGMNNLQAHRGPDGEGIWVHDRGRVGFAHRRLSIIDLTAAAAQPMHSETGSVITYNGEIYNYIELRQELGEENFRTSLRYRSYYQSL